MQALMHTYFVETPLAYTGDALRSHWIYNSFDLLGDAVVAYCGRCHVELSEMVDLADVHEQASIYSENMLHFIIEHFQTSLEVMVLRQRLLTAQIKDALTDLTGKSFRRDGDDIYEGEYKLSVSIATVSPVSGLMHLGLNISSQNTPVPTRGLADYGIDPAVFAQRILQTYAAEIQNMRQAVCKVRAVS